MEYRRLGKTGVKVSRLCLGGAARSGLDKALFTRTVHRALDYGCNFIDSANVYNGGEAEAALGQAIQGKRADLVIASKVCSPMGEGPNDRGLSRVHILRQIEGSLKRLQTDWIDIYYLHAFDPDTRFDETMRTLEDLVRQGKVRYIGVSNHSPAQVMELFWTADRLGLEPFVVLQNQYNLLRRWEVEAELLDICRRFGLGLVTYSPLAIGLLSGRYRRGQPPPTDTPWDLDRLKATLTERTDRVIQTVVDMAAAKDTTPARIAIAWLLAQSDLTAPIVGADNPEWVDDVFGALDIQLTAADMATLDAVSQWDTPTHYL